MVVNHTALHAQKVIVEMSFPQKVTHAHVFIKSLQLHKSNQQVEAVGK